MFEPDKIEKTEIKQGTNGNNSIQRLRAFWALSEAGLGGVLHITRLPFKGIFIAGAATFFISLIASFSKEKGEILKSTIIVIVIKFFVSPHTPLTAAIAVFAQGIFGELFFLSDKTKRVMIPVYAVFIQFITAAQKIIIITVLFGQNFWITLDDFANSVLNQFISYERLEFSLFVVLFYTAIHIAAGFILGIGIVKLLKRMDEKPSSRVDEKIVLEPPEKSFNKIDLKKHWFQKPSGIVLFIFFVSVLCISFFIPEWYSTNLTEIALMFVRAIIIILLWYFIISPLLRRAASKMISKQKSQHLDQINDILQLLPHIKGVVRSSWRNAKNYKGIKRVENFLFQLIQYSLS